MPNWWLKNSWFVILVATTGWFCLPGALQARELPAKFPRLANYFLNPDITVLEAEQLARWDVVIIGLEQQYVNPEIFPLLRSKNPNIIILAYALSEEMPNKYAQMTDVNHPTYKLYHGIADSWWLVSATGGHVGFWPGADMINVTNQAPLVNGERWNTFLPKFMHEQVMATGLWDGIYYDNMFNDVSWVNHGDIDTDRNGVADNAASADVAWRAGMQTMLDLSRQLEGPDAIIIGNGGGQYYPAVNGRLIEEFPSDYDGGWTGAMTKYDDVMNRGLTPAVVILNGKSSTGLPNDYRTMRYVLGSALLDNGFFSFDEGSIRHAATWLYDEYQTYLGMPLGKARRIWPSASLKYADGVWRRDFDKGVVIVNATDQTQTVSLGDGYETISGTQDPTINDGQIVSSIKLAPRDGRLLLKRQGTIDNGQYDNGSLTRTFDATGQTSRKGFFTYTSNYPGGATIITVDLNADGGDEKIVHNQGTITVYDINSQVLARFRPERQVGREVNLATSDLNGDGQLEIITAPKNGANQRVRIFSWRGKEIIRSFRAYTKDINGGVFVAAGDVNGDGQAEIVTGAGKTASPTVNVFSRRGKKLSTFYAYDKKFRGGVRVAVGDIVGNATAEIVTAPGPGGGPHVRIFNARGRVSTPGFFALKKSYRGGIFVSISDVNHNGQNSIIISVPDLY